MHLWQVAPLGPVNLGVINRNIFSPTWNTNLSIPPKNSISYSVHVCGKLQDLNFAQDIFILTFLFLWKVVKNISLQIKLQFFRRWLLWHWSPMLEIHQVN